MERNKKMIYESGTCVGNTCLLDWQKLFCGFAANNKNI